MSNSGTRGQMIGNMKSEWQRYRLLAEVFRAKAVPGAGYGQGELLWSGIYGKC